MKRRKSLKERSERAARRDEVQVYAEPYYADKAIRAASKLWREGYRLGRREASR
jgi:hypothetical protein